MRTRQAVVLVGGKGTRLGSLTAATPKPLMPLDGSRVFLDELLETVARHGFTDIVLLAGHLHEQFVARYDGTRIREAALRVSVEAAPAGTAGALAGVRESLAEQFLFLNGDTLFDVNLRGLDPLLAAHPEAVAVLGLRAVEDAGRYGAVERDGARIVAFHEKRADHGAGLVNGGVGLFRRSILDRITRSPMSIETEVYPALARESRLLGADFSGYFIDIGLPETLEQARAELPARRRRPALLLDRDGVLVRDEGYTHRVADLEWYPGAIELIRRANDGGALVVVVTNQAGVARGYYDEAAVATFHDAMQEQLADAGAHIDAFYCCFHHPEARLAQYRHPDHPDRKPNPGMIRRAMADWQLDPGRCLLVGDRETDIEAARRAGMPGLLFADGDLARAVAPALDALMART